jgi:hypothetical protein
MIVIWRGWGFIVLLFGFAAAALAAIIIERGSVESAVAVGSIDIASAALGAFGVWLFAHRIDSRPHRILIDKKTGREIRVGPSAGSLFFIKTRHWPYIMLAIGVIFAIRRALNL